MANTFSDQLTEMRAGRKVPPGQHGAEGVHVFTATVPVGNSAIADTITLARFPSGTTLVGGRIWFDAMSTGGAAATGSVGTYLTTGVGGLDLGAVVAVNNLLVATSMDAAGVATLMGTATEKMLQLTTDVLVVCVVSVEAFLAGQTLSGFITFVRP